MSDRWEYDDNEDVHNDNAKLTRRAALLGGAGSILGLTALSHSILTDDGGQEAVEKPPEKTTTEEPTEEPTTEEPTTEEPTEEPHWTESYSGRDFSGDLIGIGQSQANATADLFETAYSERGIFDVSLLNAEDVDEDYLTREWGDYEDWFLKVNDLAFPVYDGTPDTEALQGLGYDTSFVEDTLTVLDEHDELTRVGEEYADDVLDL